MLELVNNGKLVVHKLVTSGKTVMQQRPVGDHRQMLKAMTAGRLIMRLVVISVEIVVLNVVARN